MALLAGLRGAARSEAAERPAASGAERFQPRLERALDRWCRWLAGYVQRVPDTEYYTMVPRLLTGPAYRDVAGNQFAAAAAGYWLRRAKLDQSTARPLRGLIRLAIDSHVAVHGVDRPDVMKWGATFSPSDNWHADLFAGTSGILMLAGLPAAERERLRAILAWEADWQVKAGVSAESRSLPGLWPRSSVGESNALPDAKRTVAINLGDAATSVAGGSRRIKLEAQTAAVVGAGQ